MRIVVCLVLFLLTAGLSFGEGERPTIHGADYSFVGTNLVLWDVNSQFDFDFPIFVRQVYGTKNLFLDNGFKLTYGSPSIFEIAYGYGVHYYPFERFLSVGLRSYLGTFLFLDVSLILQPEVAVDIPLSEENFITLGYAYTAKGFWLYPVRTLGYIAGHSFSAGFTFKSR